MTSRRRVLVMTVLAWCLAVVILESGRVRRVLPLLAAVLLVEVITSELWAWLIQRRSARRGER